jgi:hypothetical protein
MDDSAKDISITESTTTSLNISLPNMWILHPGSALQARYSPYHTFRVQLKGSARYILISPIHMEKHAYLFPHTHVSHGQSQVEFDAPDLSIMPRFANINTYEVKTLSPGEVVTYLI